MISLQRHDENCSEWLSGERGRNGESKKTYGIGQKIAVNKVEKYRGWLKIPVSGNLFDALAFF